jgi:hypothetical protein
MASKVVEVNGELPECGLAESAQQLVSRRTYPVLSPQTRLLL